MAYKGLQTVSLHGRRFGIQAMSTSVTGSGVAGSNPDFLVGPEDIRRETTTADTTAANVKAYGTAWLQGTSAASSAVYTIDPPIPGVRKTVFFGTANGPIYLKVANPSVESFQSSIGSSFTVIKASSFGGCMEMHGITTAIWACPDLSSGTTANASSFGVTTTT